MSCAADRAALTPNSDLGFPRTCRLTRAPQYRHVFNAPRRAGGTGFILLFRGNAVGQARLGLAISKKCARRAVDRARLKRLVRESFRLHRTGLGAWDIVVLCAPGASDLANERLLSILDRAWMTIGNQQCVES
ncbi:MAG: ribonuclease P protein component [Thiocapsa sp.]|nr:ribonuclease P protein component [Thiocapsa sp.]MCG6985055.1 ribonuclease P protein component [Thiocapsa sp.]